MTTSLCRDTFGYLNSSLFQLWTCSMCYSYLFHKSAHLRPNFDKRNPKLLHNLTTDIQEVLPDIHDYQSVSEICSFLDKTNCERWKDCCSAAVSCCERQLNAFPTTDLKCPMTWDGFGCVDSTDPGTNSIIECPDFIEYGFSSGKIVFLHFKSIFLDVKLYKCLCVCSLYVILPMHLIRFKTVVKC